MENLKDRVTIYQVAQAAGVSLATVSRVINKQGNVTPKTKAKVEETIERLGYKPSGLAQALATNRTTNIGVVIPSANYVYIANMLNGITEAAKEMGYTLILFSTSHSRNEALSMIEKVISSHVDGAIIFDDELDADDIRKMNSYNVPTVCVNNPATGDKVASITFNYDDVLASTIKSYYERDGKMEMTFLHVHNCGRLLHHCEKNFIAIHEELGKTYRVYNCDDSYTRTYNDFVEYFKTNRQGIFIAYRDSIAAAVINAATDAGLRVPQDVEVVSIIGTKYSNIIRPTITSMDVDMAEVGRRSMYMLSDLLKRQLIQKSVKFDAKLVRRNSTINE